MPRARRGGGGGGGGGRKRAASGSDEEEEVQEAAAAAASRRGGAGGAASGSAAAAAPDEEEGYAGNRWSAIGRAQRYRQRQEDAGEDADAHNPLPGFIDPITLEPVINPAMSPNGEGGGGQEERCFDAYHHSPTCGMPRTSPPSPLSAGHAPLAVLLPHLAPLPPPAPPPLPPPHSGHVMGLATWRAVLQESQRCPFTKKPVTVEMVRVCFSASCCVIWGGWRLLLGTTGRLRNGCIGELGGAALRGAHLTGCIPSFCSSLPLLRTHRGVNHSPPAFPLAAPLNCVCVQLTVLTMNNIERLRDRIQQ